MFRKTIDHTMINNSALCIVIVITINWHISIYQIYFTLKCIIFMFNYSTITQNLNLTRILFLSPLKQTKNHKTKDTLWRIWCVFENRLVCNILCLNISSIYIIKATSLLVSYVSVTDVLKHLSQRHSLYLAITVQFMLYCLNPTALWLTKSWGRTSGPVFALTDTLFFLRERRA